MPPPAVNQWRSATVTEQRDSGRGNRLITVTAADDKPLDFEPGHVNAIRIRDAGGSS